MEEVYANIIERLVDDSLKGHVRCTRLLLDLAEQSAEEDEAARAKMKRNWMEELEGEPEWTGVAPEDAAETGWGGLEPEN